MCHSFLKKENACLKALYQSKQDGEVGKALVAKPDNMSWTLEGNRLLPVVL